MLSIDRHFNIYSRKLLWMFTTHHLAVTAKWLSVLVGLP